MKFSPNKNTRALIYGYAFGFIYAAVMLSFEFPDKTIAILGGTVNRFTIGFLIPITEIMVPLWMRGMFIGFLLSLPDAIITSAYIPILSIGIIGGIIIGVVERNSRIRQKVQ